ncbi:MAG: hypothetical protein J2P15_02545 [Micromonosporaceae bacterium]|nr:hypothetical protein [Micromonosporaceae bacterium]
MTTHSSQPTSTPLPEPVGYVRDALRGLGAPWFLCGGWAVDAWLDRRTRDHGDVDIAMFHRDQHSIVEHLAGWALVGHDPNVPDDTNEPWHGRHLDLPAHVHVPVLGSSLSTSATATHTAFEFEFILVERTGDDWVLNPECDITIAMERGIRQSAWGLPTAAAEVVLFIKAGATLTAAEVAAATSLYRPRDEQDFFALLPALDAPQRQWLRQSLDRVLPGHPWLTHLRS